VRGGDARFQVIGGETLAMPSGHEMAEAAFD